MRIPTCFQDPQKSEKVSPRPPPDSKMTPKTFPPDVKLMNQWKKWNHSKTTILLWFKHIQPLHSGIISIPGSPKTRTWKLSPTLVSKITENHKIMPKVGPRRLPKSIQKSIKMEIWASVRPVGVPLDPRITKMVSRAPKKEPQGL